MSRPWYPWNTASLRDRFPLVSLALSDGRLTLEPTEWDLSESELTEAYEWLRLCYQYACWHCLHGFNNIQDWEATRADYQRCAMAASAALYYLDATVWCDVSPTVLETAASHPNQSYLD